eukprot:364348-Ditylum_brightwellii.AAC.1
MTTSWSIHATQQHDIEMDKFYLDINNYFILPHIISFIRENGIGIVGTARMRKGWPPPALQKNQARDCDFNDFRYLVDEQGTLVAQCMDNGLVLVVSTLHHMGKQVLVDRRRPRVTVKNQKHVSKVWGTKSKTDIYIPLLIHNDNHWMGDVDILDQCISYYQPNCCCRRNWLPMFIQSLSMIRNNCYIVHQDYHGKKNCMIHKNFTLTMIEDLIEKASALTAGWHTQIPTSPRRPTEYVTTAQLSQRSTSQTKQIKAACSTVSQNRHTKNYQPNEEKSLIDEYPHRFEQPRNIHVPSLYPAKARGVCIYCMHLYNEKKKKCPSVDWHKTVKRTILVCVYCSEIDDNNRTHFLCKICVSSFHDTV